MRWEIKRENKKESGWKNGRECVMRYMNRKRTIKEKFDEKNWESDKVDERLMRECVLSEMKWENGRREIWWENGRECDEGLMRENGRERLLRERMLRESMKEKSW